MAAWYLGTMGFSYKDWEGFFYPSGLPARNYLTHYSKIFNAAELDSTFYGTPRLTAVQRWTAQTPVEFQFCAKLPRVITHELGLVGAQAETEAFLEAVRQLDHKLGVVLLQFPPSFTIDQRSALEDYLQILPRNVRFAVEFRHPSWYTTAGKTAAMLEERQVCWAATQYPGLPGKIYQTAGFLYVRWIGQHGAFDHHTFERIDRTEELKAWWQQLHHYEQQVEAIYGFFNNDYAGFAPATCHKFMQIAGLPVEPLQPPTQGRLF
jgi:uncharacterized protein YecE (DUF72 family)